MAYCPTPILIVSASTNRGELFRSYDALAAGAVDVFDKPLGTDADEGWEARLLDHVRTVSRIPVITHPRARLASFAPTRVGLPLLHKVDAPPGYTHVGIGASTGGPGALVTLLGGLPADYPLPILLVLHIGEPFGLAIAEWLDAQVALSVRVATDNEPLSALRPGTVIMAPADRHLEIAKGRIRLSDTPARHSCRPSVDVLFDSLAESVGPRAIACLLTGMGRDGADGMLRLKTAGALTLAQDETTSIVFGMPAEAIQLGAVSHVLPLASFAPTLLAAAGLPPGTERAQ